MGSGPGLVRLFMECLILGSFCASLLLCIGLKLSILYALCFGLLLFLLYGWKKGFAWPELGRMAWNGVKTVRGILSTFLLIGVLTACWRAAGTIPVIVCYASGLIRPSVFLLMCFLLNGAVSVLTGTAFGTAATMGVICATMGNAMRFDPLLTGGAILSGVYFGDRCSPVSTSALLVAALTETDIYRNIRRMLRSAFLPFLLSCALYLAIGFRSGQAGELLDLQALFSRGFVLHWSALLPAAVILLCSAFRVKVRLSMTASILSSIPLCLLLQRLSALELLRAAVFGYHAHDAALAAMIDGGGVLSMLKVAGIVCLSSSYTDLFQKTGLLKGAKSAISALEAKSTAFTATLLTSIAAGMAACNQTLSILLTNQLCSGDGRSKEQLALDLEDSAVVIAPLIPWSIAGGVPLSAIGAPTKAFLAAFYLYLLPLCREAASLRRAHIRKTADEKGAL